MALCDEQTDILGGPILQRPESGVLAIFSRYHLVFKSVTLFGLGLLVWIACVRGLEHLKKHRELRYRKAMRRKHGIPDSDCRPFAVAYAAAKRAHLEREAQDRKKATNYVSDHNPPAVDRRTHAQKDAYVLRKRVPETTVQLRDYHLPGKHDTAYDNKRSEVHPLDFADRYNPNPRPRAVVLDPSLVKWPSVRHPSRIEPVINLGDNEESRKRSFEDESDAEHETIKKSRIDADELIDGAEQADWYAQYSDSSSQRASKGTLDRQSEGRHMYMNGQERFKRADDIRNEDQERSPAMGGIDEGKVNPLKAVVRGKKRDRTEAGSTFGGDDEDDTWNGRALHHRKRRTISRRKTETPAGGLKRDREAESPESEGEGVGFETGRRAHHSSKKQRGKKAASDEVSEISVNDPRASKDPLCGGRRIGDEWEVDGVQYKVGGKGERLRLTLVKKARNKYHMPQDSQHIDRSAALEIYVEMWMTEEQYREAEVGDVLAWKGASSESSGSKTSGALDSPTKNGKSLLWDSVKCSPARRPFCQFIPPGSSTRINPFERWQSQPMLGRRVASSSIIASPLLPGIADSPMRPGFRGFSKWEKQDREAEAMARIRAKIEEQKKAQAPEIPTSVTAPELGTKPSSVPTITVTPASAVAVEGKADDTTSQSKSTISTPSFATSPGASNSIKSTSTVSPGATPAISLSSTFIPATTPSTLFPSPAPTAPTTTSSVGSLSPYSFAKLPQAPSSTSTATSSSTVPNVFGNGTGAGAPSAPSPGATTQLQPPSTESTSKPALFAFTRPDISSPPAVVGPSTTKSEAAPTFIATNSSSPPVFGFNPAATKAETLVPPPISASATTSESSKPTAPLFSFSGVSPSPSTATPTTSSVPPAPKFSFGQPSTILTPAPDSNQATGTASQLKPTFKFGQTLPGVANGAFAVSAADGSKKSMSTLGTAAGSNEPAKPSPFGITSAFGSSTFTSASTTNLFGKPVAVENNSSTPTPPKPTLTSASTSHSTTSSTPAGPPASSSAPVFSFGGTNSSSTSVGGSKPPPLFEGVAGGTNAAGIFGSNSTEGKRTLTFGASAEGPKPTSTFVDNTESSIKPPSVFGDSAGGVKPTFAFGAADTPKPASAFSDITEGSKPTFLFSGATESEPTTHPAATSTKPASLFAAASDISNPSKFTDSSKPTSTPGSTAFGTLPATSPFTFERDDAAANNTFTCTTTQTKPAASFTFGASSSAASSVFGQPSTFAISGDSSQYVFGKPTNVTPSAFGFTGTGGTSSSNAFTFGKPVTQNQKQEQ